MNVDYSISDITNYIKAEASRLGFCACGIAEALPIEGYIAQKYRCWLSNNYHAEMLYLANNIEKRLNPELLMPGVKSVVSLAMTYYPQRFMPENEYQIASYAYGKDYHTIIKEKLKQLSESIRNTFFDNIEIRCFCDTAPVLERYWAQKAGIGWIGRNHNLIIPKVGSMVFLGELFINIPLLYDKPMKSLCGQCFECVKSCPTSTFFTTDDISLNSDGTDISDFKSIRCLSYQTIENRSDLSDSARESLGNYIYGCDRCQLCCPHNRKALKTDEEALQPSAELMSMNREKWHNLSREDYQKLFKGSAVKRAKYEGLMRNILAQQNKSFKE